MGGRYSSKKENEFHAQLASLGLAVEALETILVEQGVLREGEVMETVLRLAAQKMQIPGFPSQREKPAVFGEPGFPPQHAKTARVGDPGFEEISIIVCPEEFDG